MQLKLQSIVIHNFKSYKGTHKIDNLDPHFTAIIGPNGSGKSNVIDSILFVLGFRAKKMRHSSVVDLIYNDGKRENMCYVELIFNKFSIKREVNINKKSRYFIDGKEVNTNEVITLMGIEGVDLEHNRFLILQGEIENIAMKKPKDDGLLDFLEDIIGTSKYKEMIDKNEEDIKQFDDEYENKAVTLKFFQKEFEHIKERKNENYTLLNKKISLIKSKKKLENIISVSNQRSLNKAEDEKLECLKNINEYKEKNAVNSKKMEKLENEAKTARSCIKKIEDELLKTKREFQKEERENRQKTETKSRLEKQISSLENELESEKNKEEMQKKQNTMYETEMKQNENDIKKYSKEAKSLEKVLQHDLEEINKKAKAPVAEIKKNEAFLINLLKEKSEIAQVQGSWEAEMSLLTTKKEELINEINTSESKLKELKNISKNSGTSAKKIKEEIHQLKEDYQATQKEIIKRRQRYEENKENEERNYRETELLKHIKNIKGVFGPLKELGTVRSQYELALSTAGKTLNSIVVDTTQTAEECINIIKKHNLARATFIILDKMKEIPNLPEEPVPYLFNLLSCEEPLKKCFYFALKDTLVCENLESGKEIAFGRQRKRVVTLDGKLIEKSGVMSGGKPKQKVKKVEDLERACSKMLEILKEKENELNLIFSLEKKSELEAHVINLKSEYDFIVKEISKKKKTFNNSDILNLENKISEVKEKIALAKSEVESFMNIEIKTKRGELQILNEKIDLLERRNQELRLMLLSGNVVDYKNKTNDLIKKKSMVENIQIKNLTELKEKLNAVEEEYKEKISDVKILQDEINKVKNEMGNDYHMEIDLKNKLDDLNDKIEDCKRNIKKCKNSITTLQREEEECIKSYLQIGEENTVVEQENICYDEANDVEIKESIKEVNHTISKIEKELAGRSVDYTVFNEFEKAKTEYNKVKEEFEWFKTKYEQLKADNENLKKSRLEDFMCGFNQITKYLKEIYKTITYGGNAELELVDYLDPFSEGVILSVMPPKKSWKNVSNLSGGEKTLSSLALIFALHKYKPSPFYVMDEIDAALDYRNVSVISHYIKEMSRSAQFLVISLRNDMFELSRTVLGVYKTNNISRFLVVNIDDLKL